MVLALVGGALILGSGASRYGDNADVNLILVVPGGLFFVAALILAHRRRRDS